jgi:hypothetical protein
MKESSDSCFSERRHSPRYPCAGEAEILEGRKRWGWGKLTEISRHGCYIETIHPLPFGTEAQLRLRAADSLLDISANVVSTDLQLGMGMNFVVLPGEQESRFAQMIEKVANLNFSTAMQQNEAKHEEAQPHMQAALQHLEQAHKELRAAMYRKGGHRALQLTESAIDELTKAVGWDQHWRRVPSCLENLAVFSK